MLKGKSMHLKRLLTLLSRRTVRSNRIIFLNNYYYPDCSATSQILTDLAEHLASSGYEVFVVTSQRLYNKDCAPLPQVEERQGVQIRRIWTTHFGRSSLVGRSFDYASFYITALLYLLFLARQNDVVVSKTDPPLIGIFAWIVARSKGAILINWCQDIFPETATALGLRVLPSFLNRVLIQLRNQSLKAASTNVAISDAMYAKLCREGISRDRILTIHNWPQSCIQPLKNASSSRRHDWNLDGRFVIGYSGNLGRAHLPDRVLDLVHDMAGLPDVIMLFVGGGRGMRVIRDAAAQLDYTHLVFKPLQPKEELDRCLAAPDLHLISLNPACEGYLMPSKYYGVLAAGKAVAFLGNAASSLAQEIKDHDCGIVLDTDAPQLWRGEIDELRRDRERLASMGRNARKLFERRYTAEVALTAWKGVLADVHMSQPGIHPTPVTQ